MLILLILYTVCYNFLKNVARSPAALGHRNTVRSPSGVNRPCGGTVYFFFHYHFSLNIYIRAITNNHIEESRFK